MQTIVSGRGVVLTPAFRDLLAEKVAKFERRGPRVLEARVTCGGEKFRRTVRLQLRTRRRTFASVATAGDLRPALEEALEAVARQLRDAADRRRRLRRIRVRRLEAEDVA
jgi:ribosomal subunit interface protein